MIALPHEQKHVDKIEALIGKPVPPTPLPESFSPAPGAPTAASEIEERQPRSRRQERGGGRGETEAPSRSRRGGRERNGERSTDKPVIGLGDHVPAFLLREVPVRRPARRTSEATDNTDEAA